jgi:prolyl-tRNA synthetase
MPVITGVKTESEKFAGALRTYATEGLMQDNKALQAGTSHNLGQNFAKAFEVQFQTDAGDLDYVWSTSWGVSTRLVGGLIMTHSDDNGLVCPPRLAPTQVVIVPIWRKEEERELVFSTTEKVLSQLKSAGVRAKSDLRDQMKPGAKYYEWEGKGVPVRLEIGPRDVAAEQAMLARRTGGKEPVALAGIAARVAAVLQEIQDQLYGAALERRDANSRRVSDRGELIEMMNGEGGFAYAGFCGSETCETGVKDATKADIRVLPDGEFRSDPAPARCVWCGEKAESEAVWARAY